MVKGKFVRNVATLVSGAFGAQVVTMSFAPFITRLYGPEEFGLLGTFMALLGVLAPIAALTYPVAIVLPKNDRDATSIVKLSIATGLLFSAVVGMLIWIYGEQVVEHVGMEQISQYMLLIPCGMFFSACYQIAVQWHVRKGQFGGLARVAIFHSFLVNGAVTCAGLYHPVAGVLIALQILSNALHAALLWWWLRDKSWGQHRYPDKAATTRSIARRYADFPIFRAPQVLVNALGESVPVIMLATLFGPVSAGFYTLSKTVLAVPQSLVGKAVSDVFYPRIAEAMNRNENITNLILKSTAVLAVLGVVPCISIAMIGPWLFGSVFGSEWSVAGKYAQWISIWLFVSLALRPAISAIPVLKKQGFFLVHECIFLSAKSIAIYFAFYFQYDAITSIAIFSIVSAGSYVVLFAWVVYFSITTVSLDKSYE